MFLQSSGKSIRQAIEELQIPAKSAWHTVRKNLQMKPYRFQLMKHLNPQDINVCFKFCLDVLEMMEQENIAGKFIFSDSSTFHV